MNKQTVKRKGHVEMPVRSFAALMAAGLLLSGASPSAEPADLPHAIDAGWNGERVCELLFENAELRVARCTFPPGIGHERHYHPRHWGHVVQGATMRITDENGTAERTFASGSSWWSDGVKWHEAVNIGQTTAVYVIYEPKTPG